MKKAVSGMVVQSFNVVLDLAELNARVCRQLWEVIEVGGSPKGLTPRLVIPLLYNNKNEIIGTRISEQEARFIYCSEIEKTNYFYSVETPTIGKYKFKNPDETDHQNEQNNQSDISARSDISLYSNQSNTITLVANIELKSGNPPLKHISNDIKKLIKERNNYSNDLNGCWFHLLRNSDSKTLKILFDKFSESLKNLYLKLSKEMSLDSVSIVFTFCILNKKWACTKHFFWNNVCNTSFDKYTDSFFELDYVISRSRMSVLKSNGWDIIMDIT